MQELTFELKYCERCGSLRLRRSQSAESYCESCRRVLLNYSSPGDCDRLLLIRKTRRPAPAFRDLDAASCCGVMPGRPQ